MTEDFFANNLKLFITFESYEPENQIEWLWLFQ